MARALLPTLLCACAVAAAAAVNYGDYSGVKMPQYGPSDYSGRAAAPADDYRDHSPDAPASLDYKYDEVSKDKIEKTLPNDVEEDDTWKKPVKKHRKRKQKSLDSSELEVSNRYKLDDVVPKTRPSYRSLSAARYRKKKRLRDDEVLSPERSPRYNPDDENRPMDTDDEEIPTHQEDLQENNNLDFERNKYGRRETRKKARRKPRDRPLSDTTIKTESEDDDPLNDLLDLPRPLRGPASEYSDPEVRVQVPEVDRSNRIKARPHASDDDDAEDRPRVPLPKLRLSTKETDYADYYDMKRVQTMKNKLPSLQPRRTTAWELEQPTTPRLTATWRKSKLFNRRKNLAYRTEDTASASISTITTTTGTTTTITITTTTTIRSTVASTENATSLASERTPSVVDSSQELSLAEKSRLSILKKAQRKESLKDSLLTKKPPVLLQVTDKMHTVVIVEPPVKQDPWLRAKEVSDDTPQRLDKVKQLMRHKLVANAKNIRDLTDNWDDMVCDYVDVGLLDTNGALKHSATSLSLIFSNVLVSYLNRFN